MGFVVTVSQVVRRLALLVKEDKPMQNISVRGEISNFVHHLKSGHMYFSLKEGESSIKVVMFRWNAERLDILPENGMNVVVSGSVQVYERDGVCQLYATNIDREDGMGEGALSFEQLKEKLDKEGLFAQKRALPSCPKSICVVTSETGAALQDILNVLSRRFPFVRVKLVPVLVQGAEAPASIAEGLELAQSSGCELIIFGRGGGSSEDLSAFNTEIVARAVYGSKIPTISAVGHEIDFSISDFAADMRAPTPSAAAELAVPDINEIYGGIVALKGRIKEKALGVISENYKSLQSISDKISYYNPKNRMETNRRTVEELFGSIRKSFSAVISAKELQLENTVQLTQAFNPMNTLKRGYSMVVKDGAAVYSVSGIKEKDIVTVKMSDGEFEAVVKKIN